MTTELTPKPAHQVTDEQWEDAIERLNELKKVKKIPHACIAKSLGLHPQRISEFKSKKPEFRPTAERPEMMKIFKHLMDGGPPTVDPWKYHLKRKDGVVIDIDWALYDQHHYRCLIGLNDLPGVAQKLDELEILAGITKNGPRRYLPRMVHNWFMGLADVMDKPLDLYDEESARLEALCDLAPGFLDEAMRQAADEDFELAIPLATLLAGYLATYSGLQFGNKDRVHHGVSQMCDAMRMHCSADQDTYRRYVRNVWHAYTNLVAEGHPCADMTGALLSQLAEDDNKGNQLAKATINRDYAAAGSHLERRQPDLWEKLRAFGAIFCALLAVIFFTLVAAAPAAAVEGVGLRNARSISELPVFDSIKLSSEIAVEGVGLGELLQVAKTSSHVPAISGEIRKFELSSWTTETETDRTGLHEQLQWKLRRSTRILAGSALQTEQLAL